MYTVPVACLTATDPPFLQTESHFPDTHPSCPYPYLHEQLNTFHIPLCWRRPVQTMMHSLGSDQCWLSSKSWTIYAIISFFIVDICHVIVRAVTPIWAGENIQGHGELHTPPLSGRLLLWTTKVDGGKLEEGPGIFWHFLRQMVIAIIILYFILGRRFTMLLVSGSHL